MNLETLYDAAGIPPERRIKQEKNVLLVCPADYDSDLVAARIGLSKWEVSVSHPKDYVSLEDEVAALNPKMVLQVGEKRSDGFPFIQDVSGITSEIVQNAFAATADKFVNLHHHDEFSIKDGLGTVDKQIALLKAQRRSYCCITNHGTVGGWIKQYNACRKAGIKAIFGMEAYVSNVRDIKAVSHEEARLSPHLILLARNKEGFDNIIRIHNDAQLNGFYYRPRANWDILKKCGRGIIATSACLAGEIPRALMAGKKDEARRAYEAYAEAFDEFYIEVQIIEWEGQKIGNRLLIEFAKEVGAPVMLACDSHYLEPQMADSHDLLMCIRQQKTIKDKIEKDDVWGFDVRNLYYRTAEQMAETFKNGFVDKNGNEMGPLMDDVFDLQTFCEALVATQKIAVKTDEIELDSTIKLPKLYDDGEDILRASSAAGLEKRVPDAPKVYNDRLEHELGIITKLGWTDYFLVVDKIVKEAVAKYGDLAVGWGRGSAGGSLVCYALGITNIDPVKYRLLFERFIDESRLSSPPDIDTDFDPRIRDEIKASIVRWFGEDKVCSIGSYQTYKTRAVILDVVRALGYDVWEVMQITKKMDPLKSFVEEDGDSKSKIDDMDFEDVLKHFPDLAEYMKEHPDVLEHVELLRDQVKNMGKHAGGMIISDLSLTDRIPVLWDSASSDDRQIISAWAESGSNEELSSVGLVKFDILGLNNLPVISDCLKLIEQTTGEVLTREQIPIDDRDAISKECKTGDFTGIFQMENPGMRDVLLDIKIESLTDIAAATSLIRPGPRDMGMDAEYARRKNGGEYDSIPVLDEILSDTHGVLVFQEQIMIIAQKVAGLSATDSYKLLKGVGKKIKSVVDSFRQKFLDGCKPKIEAGEMTTADAESIFGLIESFAAYGFNRSHSFCYGAVSAVQMWLRRNYFPEYMAALINNTKLGKKKHGSENLIVNYINYARSNGVKVLKPDVNKSGVAFGIEAGKIRYALGHIRNVSSMAEVIVQFAPFTSIDDFDERVKIGVEPVEPESSDEKQLSLLDVPKKKGTAGRKINRRVVESLIYAGAFDSLGKRSEIMKRFMELRPKKDDSGLLMTSREGWIEKEVEMIGMCLSIPPIRNKIEDMAKKKKWVLPSNFRPKGRSVRVVGRVERITKRKSKKGTPMAVVTITDDVRSMKFYVFEGDLTLFCDNVHEGDVAMIGLRQFEDGDQMFFNEKMGYEIIKKRE